MEGAALTPHPLPPAETHLAGEGDPVGDLVLAHPGGTFAPTPASLVALAAVRANAALLRGRGLDWGAGIGVLAIAAARLAAVEEVLGLELLPANVAAARANAERNGVSVKTRFHVADSYRLLEPPREADEPLLAPGALDFVLSNPPSSDGDDGFSFRRAVMAGARPLLRPGGVVFLSVSEQYGPERVASLAGAAQGFVHAGVIASTEPVLFDQARADLRQNLADYAAEEARGGLPYTFPGPAGGAIDARTVLARFRATGESPTTRWQVHLFRRVTP